VNTIRLHTKLTNDNGRDIASFITEAGANDAISRLMDLYNATEVTITMANGGVVTYTKESE